MSVFQIVHGFLIPRLATDLHDAPRVADGETFLDEDQAASEFSTTPQTIKEVWESFFSDILPSRCTFDGRPVAPMTEADERMALRDKFSHLTDDQFDLLRAECRHRGLSLWGKQFVVSRRFNCVLRRSELRIRLTVDGARMLAARTGEVAGESMPEWRGKRGTWQDFWNGGWPEAARVSVTRRRAGICTTHTAIARFNAFAPYSMKGGESLLAASWVNHTPERLADCALILAYRKAFPEALVEIRVDDRKPSRFAGEIVFKVGAFEYAVVVKPHSVNWAWVEPGLRQICLAADLRREDRVAKARHEFYHAWRLHNPEPRTEEDQAQIFEVAGEAFDQQLREQGGAEALMALKPTTEDEPSLMIGKAE